MLLEESLQNRLLERTTLEPMQEGMIEAIYRRWLRPMDVAIDGGACVGRHTVPMAECVGELGKVIAFEAVPSFIPLLEQRLLEADVNRQVNLHQCALGARADHAQFRWLRGAGGLSGLRETTKQVNSDRPIEIVETEVVTIDEAVSHRPVRFIKLDLSGGEFDAIMGATQTCRRDGPIVAFEFGFSDVAESYGITPSKFFNYFTEIEYGLWDVLGRSVDLDYWQNPRLLWNLFAAPATRASKLLASIGDAASIVAQSLDNC